MEKEDMQQVYHIKRTAKDKNALWGRDSRHY